MQLQNAFSFFDCLVWGLVAEEESVECVHGSRELLEIHYLWVIAVLLEDILELADRLGPFRQCGQISGDSYSPHELDPAFEVDGGALHFDLVKGGQLEGGGGPLCEELEVLIQPFFGHLFIWYLLHCFLREHPRLPLLFAHPIFYLALELFLVGLRLHHSNFILYRLPHASFHQFVIRLIGDF